MAYRLTVGPKNWKLRKPFTISRETQRYAETIVCEITDGTHTGRGEAAGVTYSGESIEAMLTEVQDAAADIEAGITRDELQQRMPAGGARNVVDCALWDLEAKRSGQTIWQMLGWEPRAVTTVYTVGIDTPKKMQKDAAKHSEYPFIKVKVGIGDPVEQIAAINAGAPKAAIVIDANQAWTVADLERYTEPLMNMGVEMIEQPLNRDIDEDLRGYESPVPLCADESCATSADLERLQGLYSMVNIKLDKTGGLTEALALAEKAESMGFELMVGNMLGSSLAMAPAFVIAQRCRYVDIDGPLLQAKDCDHAMTYENGRVDVFTPALWG